MSALVKRLQALLSVLSVLAVLVLAAAALGWWWMRGSLAQLDGRRAVAGLGAPVRVERDALGVPTIAAADRADAARALGFLHAQERYFQMDLLRRRAAGELAELFGAAALPVDRAARLHRFRATATAALAALPAHHRAVLDAYVAGVNAGRAALPRPPWEYAVVRAAPAPWRPEDSLLVSFAMWFDLQDAEGRYEQSLDAFRRAQSGSVVTFFAPPGDAHDAALDGTAFPSPPLPGVRLRAPAAPEPATAAAPRVLEPELRPGSNSFAVAGALTARGGALLANDMHLDLRAPNTWYRALLTWPGEGEDAPPHRVVGVTLPGVPAVIVGSNGRLAWGFTNAYIDTADVVLVETESTAQHYYRTAAGWREITEHAETIRVKGGDPVVLNAGWTEWGPILSGPVDGRYLALRWNAHDPAATNLGLLDFETAPDLEAGLAAAHRAGMPNQNILLADAVGHIAWTVTGRVPRRVGFDGRLPASWAYGDRRWEGWLAEAEVPVIRDPAAGILWTANNRVVGGAAYQLLGDGGYDDGLRAGALRDDLLALAARPGKIRPGDLLAVQLDDHGRYLERWQRLLLDTLGNAAVAAVPARGPLREFVRQWGGRAAPDSVGYRLVRAFRQRATERVLAPFFARAAEAYPRFSPGRFHTEEAVWRLLAERPANLLNPAHASWEALLLAAVDAVRADIERGGVPLARSTWGARNTLRMAHPFSRFLPGPLARLLDLPATPLPGDNHLPRVQGPDFGASERLVVSPGHEDEAIFHMPGGQSGHPLSPYYRAGHAAWVQGQPTPLLPGPTTRTLLLHP